MTEEVVTAELHGRRRTRPPTAVVVFREERDMDCFKRSAITGQG